MDFSSAFSTIDVRHLLPELKHLDLHVINWVASFLTGRSQRTVVNNITSKSITTYTGTPQSSVISPLLFSIYTNRLVSECSNVTILKYADDTCIIGCISDDNYLQAYFNEISRVSIHVLCKQIVYIIIMIIIIIIIIIISASGVVTFAGAH